MDWPGEKLVIRVWETLERIGIGAASPMQIHREGRARAEVRREEAVIDAQTQREVEAIRSGDASARQLLLAGPHTKRRGKAGPSPTLRIEPKLLAAPAQSPRDIAAIAQTGHSTREIERLLNVRATHRVAEDIAETLGNTELPDEMPRKAWIEQWYQGAAEVDEKELGEFWARLLVGEASKPGSVSPKTMQILRVMSGEDARRLEKLGPYIISGHSIVRGPNCIPANILAHDLVSLEELGLLTGTENELSSSWWPIQDTHVGKSALLFAHRTHLLVLRVKEEDQAGLNLPSIRLTTAGIQLMRLGIFVPDEDYLRSVGMLSRQRWHVPRRAGTLKAILARGREEGGSFLPENEEVLFDDAVPADVPGPAA